MVPLLAVQIAVKSVKEKMEAKSQVTVTQEAVIAHLAAILAEILAADTAQVAVMAEVWGPFWKQLWDEKWWK